jgi:hypothetical protein
MRRILKNTMAEVYARSADWQARLRLATTAQPRQQSRPQDIPTVVPIETLLTTTGRSLAMRRHCLAPSPTVVTGRGIQAIRSHRGSFGGSYYAISVTDTDKCTPYRGTKLIKSLQQEPAMFRPFGFQLKRGQLIVPDAIEMNGILDWHGRRGPHMRFATWPHMGEVDWQTYAACLRRQQHPFAQVGDEFFHDLGVHYRALYLPQRCWDLLIRRLQILFWAHTVSGSRLHWTMHIKTTNLLFDNITAIGSNEDMFVVYHRFRRDGGETPEEALDHMASRGYLTAMDDLRDAFYQKQNGGLYSIGRYPAIQTARMQPIDHHIVRLFNQTFVSREDVRKLQHEYLENAHRYASLAIPA